MAKRYAVKGDRMLGTARLMRFSDREGGIWRANVRGEDGLAFWGGSFIERRDAIDAADLTAADDAL